MLASLQAEQSDIKRLQNIAQKERKSIAQVFHDMIIEKEKNILAHEVENTQQKAKFQAIQNQAFPDLPSALNVGTIYTFTQSGYSATKRHQEKI